MAAPSILHTPRLSLRAPQARDAAQITQRIGVKDVAWNLGRAPYPYKRTDADEFIRRADENWSNDKAYVFMLEHAKDGVIGCCGLDALDDGIWEIGYWLGKAWWGQGYTSEAAGAVLDWAGKDHAITELVSGHFTDNLASGRVLEKLGFKPVGIVEHTGAARGKPSPALRYIRGAPAEAALRMASH